MTDFNVTILGTSASVPTPQRNVSANVITHNGLRIMVDCGEGTQRQMMRYGGLKAPTAIFLTHYHPDHILGLPGLLATLKSNDHPDAVQVFGPKGIDGVADLCRAAGAGKGSAVFQRVEHGDVFTFGAGLHVRAYATNHGCPSLGYSFTESDRAGHFDIEKARSLGIEPGPDFGALQRGETVNGVVLGDVVGESRKGRSIVITGDTRPTQATSVAARGADLLVHEATFNDDMADRAKKVFHSTIDEAISVGRAAGVKRLVLTHFSARSGPTKVTPEDQDWLVLARDGDSFDIPMN